MTETGSVLQQRKRKPTTSPVEPNLGGMLEANQRALENWLHGLTELSQEIAQFTQHRLQQDAEAWMKLASCRSADEALACQQRFAETAVKQYLDEASKLSQLVAGMAPWSAGQAG